MIFTFLTNSINNTILQEAVDYCEWSVDSSNQFISKYVRKLLEANNPSLGFIGFDLDPLLPIKIKCFCWRAILDVLLTKENLGFRGVNMGDSQCPFCNTVLGSQLHLHLSCSKSDMIWTSLAQWCNIVTFTPRSIQDLSASQNIHPTGSPFKKS